MATDPISSDPPSAEPGGSTTGGLPPDFFNADGPDVPERTIATVGARDGALPPRRTVHRSPQVVVDRRTSLPVVLVVLSGNLLFFLGGGLAGWALARKGIRTPGELARTVPPDPLLNEVARTVDTKASKTEVSGVESNVGRLQSEVATLSRALARMEARFDAKTSARATAPDLAPLTAKIDDIAVVGRKLVPLPAEFQAVRDHVESLDKRLDSMAGELAAFPKQFEAALVPLKDQLAARPANDQVKPADGARNLGAALFREGKFVAAREVFLKLADEVPDDARLWYFAALCNGMTSGEWGGETERMVLRGVDREKAGTPAHAEIDAQFRWLRPEQGKQWLDGWRQRARVR